jgi:hypothetical protein
VQKIPDKLEPAADTEKIVDAEIVAEDGGSILERDDRRLGTPAADRSLTSAEQRDRKLAVRLWIFLPALFLTVSLMGGLRLASPDGAFVFVAPALICLIFGVVLMGLYFRGGIVALEGWFSDDFSTTQDVANAAVLVTLFAASVQVFNSVIPESGIPFWVVAFCFAWTLWNNLFAEFDNKKLLKSMAALFAFAFVAKYIILAGLTAPATDGGWLRSMIENPARETATWLLDLPRYSSGTGYIQFFCLLLYFVGLYLLPRSTISEVNR